MKQVCIILFTGFLISSFSYQSSVVHFAITNDTIKPISKTLFDLYLKGFDSTIAISKRSYSNQMSCGLGTFKFLNKKYVLNLHTGSKLLVSRPGNYYEVSLDKNDISRFAEILVYDRLNASLEGIWTDIIRDDYAKPTRSVIPQSGTLYIAFLKPTHPGEAPVITVLIKDLSIKDAVAGKEESFHNETIWKVEDEGLAG